MATGKDKHAYFYADKDEDPYQRQRTVPMEILSLGMSRTGTMSTCASLAAQSLMLILA